MVGSENEEATAMENMNSSIINFSTEPDFPALLQDPNQLSLFDFLNSQVTDVEKYSDDGKESVPCYQYGVATPSNYGDASSNNLADSDSSLFSCQGHRDYIGTPPLSQGEGMAAVPSFLGSTFAPVYASAVPAISTEPEISFVRQPIQKYRFRYLSEEGSHGHLTAVNSTANRHCVPTLEVKNLPGDVELRVALYTTQGKCPHELLRLHQVTEGRGAQRGRRTLNDLKKEMRFIKLAQGGALVELRGLGIIKLTKDDLQESGKTLEEAQTIHKEFNRLDTCLGVTAYQGDVRVAGPIFSSTITNLRCAPQLKITRRSLLTTSAVGGQEMWLLTDKVRKGDIEVRVCDGEGWEDVCTGVEIFHQLIIICRTPAYPGKLEASGRTMQLYLFRKSDQKVSEFYDIKYSPDSESPRTQVFDARKRKKTMEEEAEPVTFSAQLEQIRALHHTGTADETQLLVVPQRPALPQEFNRSSVPQSTSQYDQTSKYQSRLRPSSSKAVASQSHFVKTFQASHSTYVTSNHSLDINWPSTQPNLQLASPHRVPATVHSPSHLPYTPEESTAFQTHQPTPNAGTHLATSYATRPQSLTTTYASGHTPSGTLPLNMQSSALFNGSQTRQENRVPQSLTTPTVLRDTDRLLEPFTPSASLFHHEPERSRETSSPGEMAAMSLHSLLDLESDFNMEQLWSPGHVGKSSSWSLVTDSVGSSDLRRSKKLPREYRREWEEEKDEEEEGEEEEEKHTWGVKEDGRQRRGEVTTRKWEQTIIKEEISVKKEEEEERQRKRGEKEDHLSTISSSSSTARKDLRAKQERERSNGMKRGESRTCKTRHSRGREPPRCFFDVNMTDKYGDALIHYAVRKDDDMAVAWLLSHGADVNKTAQLSGDTPLHLAVKYDAQLVLMKLLDVENLDLHIRNDADQTFLDVLQIDSCALHILQSHPRTREMSQSVSFSNIPSEDEDTPEGFPQQQARETSHTQRKSTSGTDVAVEAKGATEDEQKDENSGEESDSKERREDGPQISLWYYMFLPVFLAYCYSVMSYWSSGELG